MKWYIIIVFLFIVTSKEESMDESRKSLRENRTKVAKDLKMRKIRVSRGPNLS